MNSSYQSSLNKRFQNNSFFSSSPQWETFSAHSNQAEICFLDIWALLRKILHRLVLDSIAGAKLRKLPGSSTGATLHRALPAETSMAHLSCQQHWAQVGTQHLSQVYGSSEHRRWERRWNSSGKPRGPAKCSLGSAVLHIVWQGTAANSLAHLPWLRDACDLNILQLKAPKDIWGQEDNSGSSAANMHQPQATQHTGQHSHF